jgi:regulator of replication initiation timing
MKDKVKKLEQEIEQMTAFLDFSQKRYEHLLKQHNKLKRENDHLKYSLEIYKRFGNDE